MVEWIKLSTQLYDDTKIKIIKSLPNGHINLCIWIELLCLAGQVNDHGYIYIADSIPYDEESLAVTIGESVNNVKLALSVFEKYGMIGFDESNRMYLENWYKHQSLDGLDKIREQNKLRKRAERERKRQKIKENELKMLEMSRDCHVTECDEVTHSSYSYSNSISNSNSNNLDIEIIENKKTEKVKHKYGEYKNVLLTDEEMEKLRADYPDIEKRIDDLSNYIASKGAKYKSHYATIRNWARKETKVTPKAEKWCNTNINNYDMDDYEKTILAN